MALSEREQEVLRDLEEQLSAGAPDLAQAMSAGPGPRGRLRVSARAVGIGVALILVGMAILVGAVAVKHTALSIAVGVAGFVTAVYGVSMIVGAVFPSTSYDSSALGKSSGHKKTGPWKKKSSGSSFMDRQNQRWQDRHR